MSSRRLAAAVLATFALLGGAGCNKIKSKQEIKKGNEYFKAGQYQTALASYQEAQRLDPNEKKLQKNIGLAYMGMYQPGSKHQKDLEFAGKAIEHLKQYLDAYPEDKKAREFLLSLYLGTERYDDAVSFYEQMLKEDPKDVKAIGSLASIYFKKGEFDQGVAMLEKRLDIEPRDAHPEIYHLIGAQAWDRSYNYPDIDPVTKNHMLDRGMEALNKALEIRPDYFEALTYVNLLYREKAKLETDTVKQAEYLAKADEYRNQALELRKRQQTASASAPAPTPEPAS
jgi:tetratricopeptide (TPR) repeat protein